MTSQIRVDEITNRSGLGTVTIYDNGFEFTGVTTFTEDVDITGGLTIGGVLTYEDTTNIDSVGVITARAGVNISGGNLQVGGTNVINSGRVLYNLEQLKLADTKELVLGSSDDLKIYHSGSHSFISEEGAGALKIKGDDIRFENASATEAIRVSAGGSFGISTTDPTTPLSVRKASNITTYGNVSAQFSDNSTGTLYVQHSSGLVQVGSDTALSFGSGTSADERLRITSAGLVGIGTDNPTYELEVASSDATTFNITAGGNTNLSRLFFSDDDAVARGYLNYDHQSDHLLIGTAGSERLRITDAGMVGINMTPSTVGNSTYMLQMYNAGSQCFMSLGQGSGNGPLNGLVIGVSNAAHYITGRENLPMIFATNDAEKLRITSAGKFGFNQSSPHYAMHLSPAVGETRIDLHMTNDTTGHGNADGVQFGYQNTQGAYIWNYESTPIYFGTSNSERIRILSSGFVNIGNGYLTNSNSGLHVGRSSGGTAAGESVLAATLGNDSTMVSALLTVKNAGNRGAAGASGGSPLAKFEFNNGTAFEIDKNGYRTLPYQPCAMAYNAQGQHMAGNAYAVFNSTRFNIGNMYNSSNGRMTVPVDGRYLVAYSGLHDYVSQNAIGFEIRINGSKFDGGEAYQECTSSSNSQLAKTLILSLSANDYVQIFIRVSGTQVHQRYGSFSVTLIT